MKRPDFDVVVAGAGAGGAAAAYYLVRAGLRVLVVEKAPWPRYKACGGAIPKPTLARFPFDFEGVVQAAPAHVRFTYPGLPDVDVPLPEQPIVMVMRREFDAFLLDQAGAELWAGQPLRGVVEHDDHVQAHVSERTVTSRYLVGADGATSQVARDLGLRRNRRLTGTLEAEVPLNGQHALQDEFGRRAVFSLGTLPWGYAWIFPKGEHLSVGIGRFRPGRINLRAALHREVERLGISLDGVRLHGHPLPCYQFLPWGVPLHGRWPWWRGTPQEPLSTRRCVLVGDAAGLVDPLLGEGIRHTIGSARLAAEAIARDDLSGYEAAIWREIGHSLATARLVANTYYRLPWLCYQVGVRNPATVRHFVDVLTERISYEKSGRRLIAVTARWLLNQEKEEET